MFVHVCVCLRVSFDVCTYMCVFVCVWSCVFVCVCVCVCVCVLCDCVNLSVCVHARARIYTSTSLTTSKNSHGGRVEPS